MVICNDLSFGDSGCLYLAIDEKYRDSSFGGTANGGDRGIRSGVIEDYRLRSRGDRGIDQIILPIGVVIARASMRVR